MSKNEHFVKIGLLTGAYGVLGHLRLKSFCRQPESVFNYQPFYLKEIGKKLSIQLVSKISDGFRVKSEEIESKKEADNLKGMFVYCRRKKFPNLTEDEFYFSDLIGLEVRNFTGKIIGKIERVEDFGGGAILEVFSNQNESFMIPFTKEIVPKVDIQSRFVVVNCQYKTN